MQVYKIKVHLEGRVTQLLDSQKIFGALMYLLSNQGYSNVATHMVSEIEAGNMLFVLSNLIPEGYLPTPYIDIKNDHNETQTKEIYKKLKVRAFISEKELMNGKSVTDIENYIIVKNGQSSQNRITSEFYDVPGLKNDLYSVPTIKVVNNKSELITKFYFLVGVDKGSEGVMKLMKLLKTAAKEESCFLLGQRSSQGYNTYRTTAVEEIHLPVTKGLKYLNLGMLLPKSSVLDYDKSQLKLFTSERRPYYGRYPKENFSKTKNFISFIQAGSIIELIDQDYDSTMLGKSIETTDLLQSPTKTIIFGNSFLYPLKSEVKG